MTLAVTPWLVSLGQDLRYASRTLRRQPIFSVSVVVILTCGIALVTTLFTFFNATVLRPWPVSDPSSIAVVRPRPGAGERYGTLSNIEYRYLREHTQSFAFLASDIAGGSRVGRGDGTMFGFVQTQYVSANYFEALRVGMMLGRAFLQEEEDYRAPKAVVIISERVWRQYFASDPGILGTAIRVGDREATVVGVAARGFSGVRERVRVDLWLPLPALAIGPDGALLADWVRSFADPRQQTGMVFGRLRDGTTDKEAEAELDVLSRRFRTDYGMDAPGLKLLDTRPLSLNAEAIRDQLPADVLMFLALFLVMLLACANAGNLVLAKTLTRRDEIATRISLGASRSRVARQLITETLVLSFIAGSAALYVATTVPPLLIRLLGSEIQKSEGLGPDAGVFAFTFVMCVLGCAFASVGPVLQATRAVGIGGGKERVGTGSSTTRLRVSLLATQIALSTVLLISAGLLTRAIAHAMSLDPGFPIAGVQEISLSVPNDAPADALPRIREMLTDTGLTRMAFSSVPPITSGRMELGVRHPDQPVEKNRLLLRRWVSAGYFGVLGIPFIAGRPFDERPDRQEIVVSQSAARQLWPNASPIGQHVLSGSTRAQTVSHEVVGVVADVSTTTLGTIEPVFYEPVGAAPYVLVRDSSPLIAGRIRELVQSTVPGASAHSRPLVEELRDSLTSLVIGSRIAWVVGLLALVLAMLGSFGVFASMVEERRREIGVRMALGARGSQVIQLVLRGAAGSVLAGLALGTMLSLVATPLLRRALYGMSPFDPIAYLEIAAILLVSSLVAASIPAARATRVEAAVTLRGD